MFRKQIVCLDTTDSTNSDAMRHIVSSPEGSVWSARFQTAGRGQRGNKWESALGENLCFSILLRPVFLPSIQQFAICQVAALGVTDYLQSLGLDCRIKWPNDIYYADGKLCGMLIEHSLQGQFLLTSIVGIGLNVNQCHFASDAPNPTSIALCKPEWDRTCDPQTLLPPLLDAIEARYDTLRHGDPNAMWTDYHEKLYRLGTWARFRNQKEATPKEFEGRILGVNNQGCLRIQKRGGDQELFAFKEIAHIL